jgi:hypothetical protein
VKPANLKAIQAVIDSELAGGGEVDERRTL